MLPPHPDWPEPPGDDPVERLAHLVDIFEAEPDSWLIVVATDRAYGPGIRTGLTMGDFRKLMRRLGR
jgi:hypothetical protein